jgi:hypothetical protein
MSSIADLTKWVGVVEEIADTKVPPPPLDTTGCGSENEQKDENCRLHSTAELNSSL